MAPKMAMKVDMGLSSKSSDDEFFEEAAIVAEINVTPLVDVFLLLLVIFMVTSSVMSSNNIPVQLPSSSQAASASEEKPGVIVTVNSTGGIYVNGSVISRESLREALTAALAKTTSKTIVLEGDRKAVLGTVVEIMDEGKKAGALKFAVSTSPAEGK